MNTHLCSKCGNPVRAEAKFCPACGAAQTPPAPKALAQCPKCSTPLRPAVKFCPVCGYQIQPTGDTPVFSTPPLPASKPAPPEAPSAAPLPPPFTPLVGAEIPKPLPISAPPQDRRASQPEATPRYRLNLKITLALVFGALAVLCIFVVGISLLLEPSRNSILALFYSPTPTPTPTMTPNYQATNSAATSIANTATASARFATETAQASATSSARTATEAFKQTRAAATVAAFQTQTEATQLAYQTTQKVIDALDQAVVKICQGKGEPEAASYAAKRAFHPIIIYPHTYPYPDEARPQELNQLELVACVEESVATIRSTPYEQGHTCIEQVNRAKITLRMAKSGSIVRTNEVRGSLPERCAFTETFFGLTKTKLGGPINPDQVWEKVKDLVHLELKSAFIDNSAVFAINLRVHP